MSIFYTDQRIDKAFVLMVLEEIHIESQSATNDTKSRLHLKAYTEDRLARIEHISSNYWRVDTARLMALLKSQVYSGNARGAIKVIEDNIPEMQIKALPAIVIGLILFPFRFLGSIIGLGLKR